MIDSQNPQPIMHQSANFGVHTRQFKKIFEVLKDFTNEIEHKSREVLYMYQICGRHCSEVLSDPGPLPLSTSFFVAKVSRRGKEATFGVPLSADVYVPLLV